MLLQLKPLGFARSERIYFEPRINIVTKGAAARGGKILTLDCYWGEDMIITSNALKDTRYASALTYLELTTCSRVDLEECLIHFPRSERVIRVTALKMAMQRAGQIIAHHLQTRMKAKQLSTALAKIDPRNALYQHHAKTDNESVLREMMGFVNGGKKLRVYNRGVGQIVDEAETIIDDDYVRTVQRAHMVSQEEHLVNIQDSITDLRQMFIEHKKAMDDERKQLQKERMQMAEEQAKWQQLLAERPRAGAEPPPAAGEALAASALAQKGTEGADFAASRFGATSPTCTETPRAADGRATPTSGGMAADGGDAPVRKVENGVLVEKRYRRRKKGAASPTPGGGEPNSGDNNSRPGSRAPSPGPDLDA